MDEDGTLDRSDEPVRDYSVGDLAGDQEQGETDLNSPVVIPNHARSHDENDCRSGQKRVRLEFNGVNSPVAHTFCKIYPQNRKSRRPGSK